MNSHEKTLIPYLSSSQIREKFISFFQKKEHQFVRSSSIAPQDDPSLMFTNAGMNQFKNIFLGKKERKWTRVVNSQKCLRVSGKHNDLEEVGHDSTHHTLFEMLGNWSFGDYYKAEAISWAWEFLTEELKLPKNRLFVTIYKDDDESESLWKKQTDISQSRILRFDKDNFWEMGSVGPCGPCTEIHFDNGDLKTQEETYKDPLLGVNGENERYVEIWNLVFIQSERLEDSSLKPLKQKHVDTGAGLERLARIIQGKNSNYDIDIFSSIIKKIEELSHSKYEDNEKGVSHRVIADHIRAMVFSISDGVTPGNEGRGYVIRRILRRASRYAHLLGQKKPFLYKIVGSVVEMMGESFPEIKERQNYTVEVIKSEEERFLKTLDQGLSRFNKLVESLKQKKKNKISGQDLFLFHDTYGFPVDLVNLLAKEINFLTDEKGFEICMEEQKTRARKAAKFDNTLLKDEKWEVIHPQVVTEFIGYETLEYNSKVLRFCESSDSIFVILDTTPFYAESGGQIGDTGTLKNNDVELKVVDTFKLLDMHIHKCVLSSGLVSTKTMIKLKASVDLNLRSKTKRNHSATHLLHSALRQVLGNHVIQQGSFVGPEYLRFDFTHHQSISKTELNEVSHLVNTHILKNDTVSTSITSFEQAKSEGVMALFGEKYEDKVRVLSMGDFSKELCGGTHVSSTGEIGGFHILSESSISAGVRRIEAITGEKLFSYIKDSSSLMNSISQKLKTPQKDLVQKIDDLNHQIKEQQKRLDHFVHSSIKSYCSNLINEIKQKNLDCSTITKKIDTSIISPEHLQKFLDLSQNILSSSVACFTYRTKDALIILIAVGQESQKFFNAGKILKELCGIFNGKGGGRNDKARGILPQDIKEDNVYEKFLDITTSSKNLMKP